MSAIPDETLEFRLIECARSERAPLRRPRVASPYLAALGEAGTAHVYADTADVDELLGLITVSGGVLAEIDGNTANQPLVRKVVSRYLDERFVRCAEELRATPAAGPWIPLLYAVVCGRIGNDVVTEAGSGLGWEASLQLHMGLARDAAAAERVGRYLRRMVPDAIVKVPFTPHAPECFLVARNLERDGIPVNFTSTFSARQTAAAALLADVTRTNVFMGRLDQGLEAELLGAHVDLEAQRLLRQLRARDGVKTRLNVASLRDWHSIVATAGCDVYTAPCAVLDALFEQTEVAPEAIVSRLETSYEDRLGISERVQRDVGAERIARLHRVEPEFVEFLRTFGASAEWRAMRDPDALYRRFDEAGWGDVFHAPSAEEWRQLRRRKLPDPQAPVTRRVALDTLYSLLADGDFENHQDAIDEAMRHRLGAGALDARSPDGRTIGATR